MTTMSTTQLIDVTGGHDSEFAGTNHRKSAYNDYMSNNDVGLTQGERVKLLRDRARITQRELVEALRDKYDIDVQESFISNIERDKANPPQRLLIALAKELDATTDFILGLSDSISGVVQSPYQTSEANEVATQLDMVASVYIRQAIVDMVGSMVRLEKQLNANAKVDVAGVLRLVEQLMGKDGRSTLEKLLLNDKGRR